MQAFEAIITKKAQSHIKMCMVQSCMRAVIVTE